MPLPVCLGFGPKSGRPGSACVRVAAGLQWVYPRFPWRVPSEGTLQAGFWRYYRLRRFFLWCLFCKKRCIHAPLRWGSLGVPLVRNRFSRCASAWQQNIRLHPGRISLLSFGDKGQEKRCLACGIRSEREGHKKAAIFKEVAAFRI